MPARGRILLVPAGGTISTIKSPDGYGVDSDRALESTADALLGLAPHVRSEWNVRVAPPWPSAADDVSIPDLLELARTIGASRDVDGCVITHGTDMIEEVAYYLSLVCRPRFPVVLTGAMRPPYVAGCDGGANLVSAFGVAGNRAMTSYGPVVVFHDEIHAARWVTKINASLLHAFASPGAGPIGCVIEGHVVVNWGPPIDSDFLGQPTDSRRRVEILWTYAGVDGAMVDAALGTADGLVVAGAGGGHVTISMSRALSRAVQKGVPVVLASRTMAGPTLEETFSGPGTEVDLLASGLLPSGGLSPVKARLKLLVALELGLDPKRVFPARSPV